MTWNVIGPLKALIVVLVTVAIGVQMLVPLAAAQTADANPAFGYLAVPYSVVLIAIIACGEVAAGSIWPLLTHVQDGSIFSAGAFRWVDVIIYAGGAATVLSAALTAHEFVVVGGGPVTVPLGLVGMTATAAAFTLLMLVMRGLLRSAVAMRGDLDEVI